MLRFVADAGASLNTRYAAPGLGILRSVPLDGMTAIYDRRSGQTHLLGEAGATILEALANRSFSVAELGAELSVLSEAAALSERLDELLAAGIIERE